MGYLGALVAGSILTAYASNQVSQAGGSCAMKAPVVFVPLLGPWVYSASFPAGDGVAYRNGVVTGLQCNDGRSATQIGMTADEILQLGGAAMVVLGFTLRHPDRDGERAAQIVVHPGAAGAPLGLTVTGGL